MGPSEEEESRIKSRDPFEGYRGVLDVLHVRYKSPKQLSAEIFGRNKSCLKLLERSPRLCAPIQIKNANDTVSAIKHEIELPLAESLGN